MKQPHAVARRFLPEPAGHTPLLPGADQVAYVDIDDTIRRAYGYAKQGPATDTARSRGSNALIGIVSTPAGRPGDRRHEAAQGPVQLRTRRAAAFVAEIDPHRASMRRERLLVVRADSAFYGADVVNACRALDVRFSLTVRMNASVKAAIAGIDEATWKAIKYPKAISAHDQTGGDPMPNVITGATLSWNR